MEARKIIITGGATRIGAAIAKKLSGPNNRKTSKFAHQIMGSLQIYFDSIAPINTS